MPMLSPFSHTVLICGVAMLPSAASAHGDFDSRPMLDGMLHVFTSPLCYALLTALVLLSTHLQEQLQYKMVGAAGLGAGNASAVLTALGSALDQHVSQAAVAFSAAVLGLLAALAVVLQLRLLLALGTAAGALAAIGSELDVFNGWRALGVMLSVIVISAVAHALLREALRYERTLKALPLAKRIAGAWIVCIGLLVLMVSSLRLLPSV